MYVACMAVRLALEFNSTTLKLQNRERTQVEKHMRICITVDEGNETAVTVAASEPILSEGARHIMKNASFDLPRTLLAELEGPGLDKGDRGELICLALLTLACDKAKTDEEPIKVLEFMEKLVASGSYESIANSKPARLRTEDTESLFRDAFANAQMHFNHFIKIQDPAVINRKYLWRFITRGAAVLCATNQVGVDVIVPFLYSGGILGRQNISAILIQVKNDKRYSSSPNRFLFDAMNPYFLRLFDKGEEKPVPIIRMVFALAASDPSVKSLKEPERKNETRTSRPPTRSPEYTSYDIWCAKASAKTFAVIDPVDEPTYEKLLKVSRVFPRAYDAQTTNEDIKIARRNMNPGTATGAAHWSGFEEEEMPEGKDEGDDVDYDTEECEDVSMN
jgi:hypothetical protein